VRPSHTFRKRFPGGMAGGDDWAWRILNNKPIVIQGDGTTLWTWTHSDDFAVPFSGLLGNDRAAGKVFHITRHMEAFTWNDIYTQMGEALGVETQIVHVPTDTLCRYNSDWEAAMLGDKTWCAIFDNSKVMNVAGEFSCKVGLAEGMKRVAEDFLANRRDSFEPDADRHALLDRVVADQLALGN
jgi:nucleoside-diphosphate-sugar epimerase